MKNNLYVPSAEDRWNSYSVWLSSTRCQRISRMNSSATQNGWAGADQTMHM